MGMTTVNPAEYGRLLAKAKAQPKVIETAAEFRQARELLENLTFADHDLSAC